jgi:Pyridoxamine 5'-phosphate oxidase
VPLTGLPEPFLKSLEGREELLVTSREGGRPGTVPVWFVVGPPGVVYLFADAYSRRARRWRTDPWVRLTVPGTAISLEGTVEFVSPSELDPILSELIVDRWGMWGAATPEGLRRMIRDGSHVLVRVDGR